MSCQRHKTYTALVGWKRDLAGFAGVITGIPEIRATAPPWWSSPANWARP